MNLNMNWQIVSNIINCLRLNWNVLTVIKMNKMNFVIEKDILNYLYIAE